VRDPLEELVFARTSGFLGPLVVLTHQKFSTLRGEIRAAGALDSFLLPIDNARLDQLLALIETLPSPLVAFHQLGLLLDVVDHTIHHRGHSARLSQREFAILHCLVWSEGRPVRFDAIHAYVWGTQRHPSAMREIIDVNVSSLRKKLKRIGLPSAIRTFREFGYGLSDGVER
jgi:DNA-binding response OmpR family regulator